MTSIENQDSDKSKTEHFSLSQLREVLIETQEQSINKNIDVLKKLRNSEKSFDKFYDTLSRIIMENDYDAFSFCFEREI